MHFTELAPVYQTMPINWLRETILQGRAGAGLAIVGRASYALAKTLDTQAMVFDHVEPLETFASRLRDALPSGCVDRLLVITDPDVAELLLDTPECLLDLGLRIRRGLIMPVVGENFVALAGSSNLSVMEEHEGLAWRWIDSKESLAELTLLNSGPPMVARFRFTPGFSPFAIHSQSSLTTTLSYEAGDYSGECAVSQDQTQTITIPLARGYVTIKLKTALSAGPWGQDHRMLSMALVSPQVLDDAGRVLLDTPQFGEVGPRLPIIARRERLHRAGFYAVGGLICGDPTEPRPISQTLGSPNFGPHLSEIDLTLTEPLALKGEVIWLAAGPPTMEAAR
jgi:hypothetical protein